MSTRINNVIIENIQNNGSPAQLKKKLKEIFDKEAPGHLNYKDRMGNIAITESTNVLNTSAFKTAVKAGAKKKYLMGVNDARQGGDSKAALSKYGSEDKAIPVDKPFKFSHKGRTYEYMFPPNRPRDRELVMFTFE